MTMVTDRTTTIPTTRSDPLFYRVWGRVAAGRDERGDVPGWVMIVVMTAGLVAAITTIAGGQLQDMLRSALASVGG
ncbi:MAG: hypothetical protein M3419_08385 [Actinomycetota bacterium]|nr:hypothetical protein [Actinomycetota bacterium]